MAREDAPASYRRGVTTKETNTSMTTTDGTDDPRQSVTPEPVEFDLFNLPPDTAPADARPLTATERFEQFHEANPSFYDAIVKLARRYIGTTGRSAVGMQRLIEIARWDMELATTGDDEFKVNNDHAAFYSRLVMLREPDLAGKIPIRSSPEADAWIAILKHGMAG